MPRIPTLVLALTLAAPALLPPASAAAQAATPAAPAADAELTPKQQLARQLRQRNALYRKLYRLDGEAADAVKRGERPLAVHARQQTVQDELNVVEMRVAILASRHQLDVPEPPASPQTEAARKALQTRHGHNPHRNTAESIAADGVARTDALIREQTNLLLARLSFRGFPTETDPSLTPAIDPSVSPAAEG